ncbi:InlB B-repeat-containing protein [Ruminococcus albus]|uniref:InlB B-repeat-containing protein n=1 Tax=Ruminococcus albus TaxID=1264 RepID=UPI00048EF9E0|nr:InlB B-repeat-containing protein [Ruminococcus albus]
MASPIKLSSLDSQTITFSEDATFTVTATGTGDLTYTWESSTDGENWTTVLDANTATLTVAGSEAIDGTQYRCIVSDNYDQSKTSNAATLTVYNYHTITYNAGNGTFSNGSSTYTETVDPGYYYIGTGEDPYLEGHVFLGWTYNGKYKNRILVSSDVTLTAEWEKACQVIYNANGGQFSDGNSTHTLDVDVGTYRVDHEEPTREGYLFAGWKYKNSFVRKLNFSGETTPEFIAEWEEAIAVTYDANGGQWKFDEDPFTTMTIYEPYGLYFPGCYEPEREGYVFDGWMLDDNYVDKIDLTEPVTFKACWKEPITVTYDPNGGSWDGDSTPREYDERKGDYWVSCGWPDKDGYYFIGWSTDPEAVSAETDFGYTLTGDTKFYAVWGHDITVYYDANGGFLWDRTATDTRDVRYGDFNIEGWCPYYDGPYEFKGWSTTKDGTVQYQPNDHVEFIQNTTLYAVWEKLPTIAYDANGGAWFNDRTQQHDLTIKMDWDQPGFYYYVRKDEPQRPGYRFNGWVDENGKNANERELLLEKGKDYTFKASWVKIVKVKYNANGGQFNDWDMNEESGENAAIHYRYGDSGEYYLDGWRPEREGYEFCGWALTLDGEPVSDPYILPDNIDEIEFYAVWAPIPIVTYDANGGGWGWNGEFYDHMTEEYEAHLGDYGVGNWWPEREKR